MKIVLHAVEGAADRPTYGYCGYGRDPNAEEK
jgi:hypothetical protein